MAEPRDPSPAQKRRAVLKKQVRHPYITGQELKGPASAPAPADSADPKKAPPPA
ncbi:MAG: hypothetical protein HYW07_11120 [Candidatus Latescibacteria bacterium]|nr:hypothetical protein [Candidatus Latescibacterota bacterium]